MTAQEFEGFKLSLLSRYQHPSSYVRRNLQAIGVREVKVRRIWTIFPRILWGGFLNTRMMRTYLRRVVLIPRIRR